MNIALLLILAVFLNPGQAFAQANEAVQEQQIRQLEQEVFEKEIAEKKRREQEAKKRFISSIELEGKYESNPRLTKDGKGDMSTRIKFSTQYRRPLAKGFDLNVNYDIDGTFYSEFIDLTNILNHLRISLERPMHKMFTAGGGYDVSSFYYPQEKDSDYIFHKGFIYLKHNIHKNFYHQVMLEDGVKQYHHAKPYFNSTTTYLDKERKDLRHGIEHSIGWILSPKSVLRLRTKYAVNDANALYQDYHDYSTVDIIPTFNYKLTEKMSMNLTFSYTDKTYKDRLVGTTTDKRRDKTYSPSIGFRYLLTKSQTLLLGYAYSANASNDPTSEYKSNTVNWGWQYGF
jgi:hypothetical protein